MKISMQTWLSRIRIVLAYIYRPSRIRPTMKPSPTGPVFDLMVVTLFFVLGVGLWIV